MALTPVSLSTINNVDADFAVISDSMYPGSSVVTLIGPLKYSARSDSPSDVAPALLAAYAALTPGTPLLPSTDDTSTRCPLPAALNISSAVSIWTSAAMRFVSMVALLAHSLPDPSG